MSLLLVVGGVVDEDEGVGLLGEDELGAILVCCIDDGGSVLGSDVVDDVEGVFDVHEGNLGVGVWHLDDELTELTLLADVVGVETHVDFLAAAVALQTVAAFVIDVSTLRYIVCDVLYVSVEVDAVKVKCVGAECCEHQCQGHDNLFHSVCVI